MRTFDLDALRAAVRDAPPSAAPADLAAYIARGVRRDASKPFITWYDDSTGERVELSYATFANWVWKTANFLRDALDVQPGDEVGVLLRTHWQTVAIWYAAWSAGAVVVPLDVDSLSGSGAVAVFAQEDALDAVLAAKIAQGQVVGLSLRPMAARLSLPRAGVTDFAAEVPGYGDSFSAGPAPTDADATPGRSAGQLLAAAAAAAAAVGLQSGDRVLCTAEVVEADAFAATVLATFDAGAGIVLSPRSDPAALARRGADERVTVLITGPPGP
jgi:uncharacterized protein (TIGR03089 family)